MKYNFLVYRLCVPLHLSIDGFRRRKLCFAVPTYPCLFHSTLLRKIVRALFFALKIRYQALLGSVDSSLVHGRVRAQILNSNINMATND